jgi:hypothetical protein
LKRPAFDTAGWELGFGLDHRFKVFYRVVAESHEVEILAVSVKEKDRLLVGGEEVEL